MKNINLIIIFLLIGVAVVYVVYHQQQNPVMIRTKTELVKGREEVSFIKGKEEKRKDEKRMMVRILHPKIVREV